MNEKHYITSLVEKYLIFKKGLGFELRSVEKSLHSFAAYLRNIGYDGYLTKKVALKWICKNTNSSKTKGRRLEILRPFMKYAHTIDENNEAIYSQIFPSVRQRPRPHIYSEEEVLILIQKCEDLASKDKLRIKSMQMIIGLLWSTGMRPNEVASLLFKDFDGLNNIITIHDTKLHKERIIPIHASVAKKINEYISFLNENDIFPNQNENLFYTTGKQPFTLGKIQYAFKLIRDNISHDDSDYLHVRLYDFRHTFACRVVYQWLINKEDINAKLYILSCYLGHEKPQETYWYLSSSSSLMNLVSNKYEEMVGDFR